MVIYTLMVPMALFMARGRVVISLSKCFNTRKEEPMWGTVHHERTRSAMVFIRGRRISNAFEQHLAAPVVE
ncbi:hypothetical protein ABIB54_002661 [Frigoribacterium sp. UYMn621]